MNSKTIDLTGSMRLLLALTSILMIVLGCYLFIDRISLVWVFFASVTVRGITLIVKFLSAKESRNGWDLINGILFLVFGCWMLTGDFYERIWAIITMEYCIAIWMVVAGLGNIFGCFSAKKAGSKSWLWMLVGGALSVIAGSVVFCYPLFGAAMTITVIAIFAGIALIINGFTGLAAAFTTNKAKPA